MKASVTHLVFLSFRVKALLSYRPLHSPFLPNRSYAVFEDLANANVCVCRFLYIPAPSFNALKWREKGYACILRLGVGVRGVVDAGLIICTPHHYLFIPTEANVWEYESKGAVKMWKTLNVGWAELLRAVGTSIWKPNWGSSRVPVAAVERMKAVCLTLSVVVILARPSVWISRRKPLLLASYGELP